MTTKPLFVHCCHCRWCQRETGASFALNALIEARPCDLAESAPEVVNTSRRTAEKVKDRPLSDVPHRSLEQLRGAGDAMRFVRVGTLDEPDRLPPDIHIYTSSKQPWVVIPPNHRG